MTIAEPSQCDTLPRRRTSFRRCTLRRRDRTAVKRSNSMDSIKGRVGTNNARTHRTFFDHLKKLVGKKNKPKKASSNLFGRPLEDLSKGHTEEIPSTILYLMHILAVHGPATTGVLRKVAKVATISEVRASLEKGQTVDEAMADLVDTQQVNVAAALLKSFLRELPDCLLQCELFSNWLALLDTDSKVATAKRLVSSLLPCHQVLLQHVVCLMRRIAASSDINLMTSSNLAVCLGPNLLWSSKTEATSSPYTAMMVNRVVQLLIDNCLEIFDHDVFESTGDRHTDDVFLVREESHSGDATTENIVDYRCSDLVMEHRFCEEMDVNVNMLDTSQIVPSVDSLAMSSDMGNIGENPQIYQSHKEEWIHQEITPKLLSCSMFRNNTDSNRCGDIFSFDTGYGSFTSSNESDQLVPVCDGQRVSPAHCDDEVPGTCCKSDEKPLSESYDSFLVSTVDLSIAGRDALLLTSESRMSSSQCSSGIFSMRSSTSTINSQANLDLCPLSPKHRDSATYSSLPDLPSPSLPSTKKSGERLPRFLSAGDKRTQPARSTPTGWGLPALIKPALKKVLKVKNTLKSLAGTHSYSIKNVAPGVTVNATRSVVSAAGVDKSKYRQEQLYLNSVRISYTGTETSV